MSKWDRWSRICIGGIVVLGIFAIAPRPSAAQQRLASSSFQLRGAVVASHSSASSTLGGVTRLSFGPQSGLVLHGGLWPALVGAAFDQDRDLIANAIDNCTERRNSTQLDADEDGYGNPCDADLNQDGIVNFLDLSLLKAAFFTEDPAADLNGNGLVNFEDLQLMKAGFFKPPGPAATNAQ